MKEETKWTWEFRDDRLLIGRGEDGRVTAVDMAVVTSVFKYDHGGVSVNTGKSSYQLHDITVEEVLEHWVEAKANYA